MSECKITHMEKDELEKYLHDRWGDKIGETRKRINSVYSREFRKYMRENSYDAKDTRRDRWEYNARQV